MQNIPIRTEEGRLIREAFVDTYTMTHDSPERYKMPTVSSERMDVHVFGVKLGTCSSVDGVDPIDLQYTDFKPEAKFIGYFPQVDEPIHLFIDIYNGNFVVYGTDQLSKDSIIRVMTQIYKEIGKPIP